MAGMTTLLAFAETVHHASFAGAAREMGLSASAVAKSVARLEADLGLRLLHRTTRQVSLTADGADLYERCRRIVEDMAALREEAQGVRGAPSGTLRLNLPLVYGRAVVVPKLAALTRRYPELALELSFSDRYVDMVRERLDAVVRIGQLTDSTLVARRIGMQGMGMLQLPDYMANVAFKARRVVELLPAFRPPALAISLVLPSARQMTPRIRVLVEALADAGVSGEAGGDK